MHVDDPTGAVPAGAAEGDAGGGKQPAAAATIEDLAREQGWKDPADWQGEEPEGGLQGAADYLRTLNARAQTRAEKAEKKAASQRKAADRRLAKVEKDARERRVAERNEMLAEFDEALKIAARAKDDTAFDKITKEKAKLEKEAAKDDGDAPADYDLSGIEAEHQEAAEALVEDYPESERAEVAAWLVGFQPVMPALQKPFWRDHAWVLDDKADLDALRVVVDLMDGGKFTMAEALEKADVQLRRAFPDQYEDEDMDDEDEGGGAGERQARQTATTERRPKVPLLAGGHRGGGGAGRQSAASQLTEAQRAIGRRMVENGDFANLNEYAVERLKLKEQGRG